MQQNKIYLDYAANTPVDPRVFAAMKPFLSGRWGNASGIHQFAADMKTAVEDARSLISSELNAGNGHVVFTGSATESNNLALKGIAAAYADKGRHIIISAVEHASVYETARYLEKQGFEVTRIPVDGLGNVDPEQIKENLRSDTILVSVVFVNNEIGTIAPISEIGKICREAGVLFHSDAAQGFAKLPLDVQANHIDLLSASAQKIYGPTGAGLLFLKNGVKCEPLLHGGGQEGGLRSSTLNVAGIAGLARAVEIYQQEGEAEHQRLRDFKEQLYREISNHIPDVFCNSDPQKGMYNILNFSFAGVDNELLAMLLDQQGIAVSTGSSCSAGKFSPSRVLKACKHDDKRIRSALRLSLGRFLKAEDAERIIETLALSVQHARSLS